MEFRKLALFATIGCMTVSMYAQDPVNNLQDLVGRPRNNGDRQMQQRGFTFVRTEGSGSDVYSYYTEARSGRCLSVHIADNRYDSIVYTPSSDCQRNNGGGGGNGAGSLQDLVGARGGDGEYQLQQRGYNMTRNETRGNSRYSYWRKGRECVEVELSNGRYNRLSDVGPNQCREGYNGGGGGGGYNRGPAGQLQDLVGARGGDGEYQMQQRGFTMSRNEPRGNSRYMYWRKNRDCVEVILSNGRYDRINDTDSSQCRGGGGGGFGGGGGGFGANNDNQITDRRSASIRGGGGEGKCTIEVVVDNTAEVEIRGSDAVIRTLSGGPSTFRRFECNQPMPRNPYGFRFKGVDGRGSQDLARSPDGGGPAVIRIVDSKGGTEGYTFDIFWNGGR